MKKLISSIVIYSLLLQILSGCYSLNNITLDELKNYKGNNEISIITTNDKVYKVKRDSDDDIGYYSDWKYVDNGIKWIETKQVYKLENQKRIGYPKTDTTFIKEKNIKLMELEEFDVGKTMILPVGILFVMYAILAATWSAPF